MMKHYFTDHPASVGKTYTEHMAFAAATGGRIILGGVACILHGLLPFCFTSTGSRIIAELSARMSAGPRRKVMAREVKALAPATAR